MNEFKDKVVVITGAGGGLGRAHALEFAKRGAKLVVNDLGGSAAGEGQSDMADQVVAEIRASGGIAIANKASVSDRAGAKSIIEDAVSEFGTIDILVNNAGILRDKSFKNMSLDDWDLVINVHLNGTAYVTHAAWPIMYEKNYGRIVLTSSTSGIFGNFGQGNYGAGKNGHGWPDECTRARGRFAQYQSQHPRTRRRNSVNQHHSREGRRSLPAGSRAGPPSGDPCCTVYESRRCTNRQNCAGRKRTV